MAASDQKGDRVKDIEPAVDDGELTRFQWEILYLLAREDGQSEYGLGIKRALEAYYGEEVNHGRLYPNLDQLVDAGYLKKRSLDKRTNLYELTDEGKQLIHADAQRRSTIVDGLLWGDA
ncbi:PadR family transcriptional regulator [Halomicroarcula sp. S1AR25-4]|uniref:PadR family transcriptional regulator n=1 Tax=Haloarcula sp. S1AR25-4 TaxID=2950538 RepID=UPI002876FD2A|nr:PadR family transcriptional regulator [Halomicroarcula sp. S1AR25-4]MDS0280332.1 PadR family transcriptional regulator [Halomicroarcula sp. S1AR25-4]